MSFTELVDSVLADRYRVARPLGRGGMGAVYEAVQLDLNRRVAIKVLAPELASDPRCVERFRREAEAAAALGHPSIVQVTDFGVRAGEPAFLVMELLSGEPLERLLTRQGALEPARACALIAQVLSALEAAHAAGIVHRDLKPANVFVTPLGGGGELVKLLAFGIAKLRESDGYARLTSTGDLVGTPRYAAPEQLDGRPVDARTDVYAAGVLLYCMVTGRPPFEGESAQLALRVLTTDAPDPRRFAPSLDARLVDVIARAMRKSPDERFQSARDMAYALGASMDRTSSDAPVRKAIARPEGAPAVPAAAPALAATAAHSPPAPLAPRAPRRRSTGLWLSLLLLVVGLPVAACGLVGVVSLVGVSGRKEQAARADAGATSPAPASASGGGALPPECDELREVACHYPRALTRTATCTRAALIRSRLRSAIERDPSTREAARDECRREADELRARAAEAP
ncbi:MAG: serine/threonine protein kinase [Sandaracinaceae bacterium]|nr:serine/threonine protein kinase [Sandaracinaceae bacterium]